MDKHYVIKQDIINFLTKHDDIVGNRNSVELKEVHFNKIQSELSQYTKNELLDYLDELSILEYIYCSLEGDNSAFFIKAKGRTAFHENRFIIDGKKAELEVNQIQSVISTNKFSRLNVYAAIIFGLLISIIQVHSCYRERVKDKQEANKLIQDSIKQSRQSLYDSELHKLALRILDEQKNYNNVSSKKKDSIK